MKTWTGTNWRMSWRSLPPVFEEGTPSDSGFTEEAARPMALAGLDGVETVEVCRSDNVLWRRHCFQSSDNTLSALRFSVENVSAEPLHLDHVCPLSVEGDSGLIVDSTGLPEWRVFKLGRFKSDVPGVFRPSHDDDDLHDAAFNAQHVTAGMGIQGDLKGHFNTSCVVCEPAIFIKRDAEHAGPGVFIGVLDQKEHLTSLAMHMDASRHQLRRLDVTFEYDGVLLDPDDRCVSHWLVVYESGREDDAVDRFVALQSAENHLQPPRERLNLFCSWYFYGREFLPEDLLENLAELKKRPIPFDVFIIDNGWIDAFGDFNANEKWPQGMAWAAARIREAGLVPGIWTAPFVMMKHSNAAQRYPQLIARNRAGEPLEFGYVEGSCYIVDPSAPGAAEYIQEIFSRLKGWGFLYHKLDFVRALAVNEDIRFHDPKVNRPMAYRLGLQLIRAAVGPDAHILACGGVYDAANFGVADSIRTGSDSIGSWDFPGGERTAGTLVQIKQGLVRNYLSRMIQTDPDSLMLRRRTEPFRLHQAEKHNWLSDGKFTDEEAFSLVIKQYLGGGNTNVTERLVELPEDRRALLRHILPAFGPPARILDLASPNCPSLALSAISPADDGLAPWYTLAVSNWSDGPVRRTLRLADLPLQDGTDRWAVLEFREQHYLGLKSEDERIELQIPAHGTRLLRLTPWHETPLIIGTDLHASGGAAELRAVVVSDTAITGRIETPWQFPVNVWALFPRSDSEPMLVQTCRDGSGTFQLSCRHDRRVEE